eukprot:scaffold18804_cov21-Tisochrysis_lutea.AAC.1
METCKECVRTTHRKSLSPVAHKLGCSQIKLGYLSLHATPCLFHSIPGALLLSTAVGMYAECWQPVSIAFPGSHAAAVQAAVPGDVAEHLTVKPNVCLQATLPFQVANKALVMPKPPTVKEEEHDTEMIGDLHK